MSNSKLGKAKDGASGLFSKAKTEVFRTAQKAMVKMGKAEETIDIEINQDKEKFFNHYKAVKKLNKDTKRLLELMQELAVVQATVAEDFALMFDTKSDMYNASLKCQDATKLLDGARLQFDEQMRKDMVDPTSKYLGQFKEMKARIAERDTRLVDMDRYGRDLQALREKAYNGKIPAAEQKYNSSKNNYNSLNEELLRDLPALYQDRVPFFTPALATYLTGIAEYYRQSSKFTGETLSLVAQVNRQMIHEHKRITTTNEASAAHYKQTAQSAESGTLREKTAKNGGEPSAPPMENSNETFSAPSNNNRKSMPPVPVKKTQMRAKALYDFNAQEENELPFKFGDVLTIHVNNGEWWEAELNGRKGLIPGNYVQML